MDETTSTHDELELVHETTVEGQTFLVRARFVAGERVAVDFVSDAGAGSLSGEIAVEDLLPATRALSSLLGGVAVATGQARARRGRDPQRARQFFPNAYRGWTESEEGRLLVRYREGASVEDLSVEFGRQPGGVRSRLAKLGLELLGTGSDEAEADD